MKRGAKIKPTKNSKGAKYPGSHEKLQTISSMFQRTSYRQSSVKSDISEEQSSCNNEEDEDVIIVNVEETSSPYFSSKLSDGSTLRNTPRKLFSKPSNGERDEVRLQKKRKLSLKKEGAESDRIQHGQPEIGKGTQEKAGSSKITPTHFGAESKESDHSTTCVESHNQPKSFQIFAAENNIEKSKRDDTVFKYEGQRFEIVADMTQPCSSSSNATVCNNKSPDKSSAQTTNENSMKDNDTEAATEEGTQFTEPYYFNNFETILSTVLQDESNAQLFNDEDRIVLNKYNLLSDAAKKIYIRLFSRRLQWIPLAKMNYPEIDQDLKLHLDELVEASFASDERDLTDLRTLLEALSAPDVKALAKVYHVPPSITQKGQQVVELLKQTQRTNILAMFGSTSGRRGLAQSMMNRAKKFISGVYKLSELPRAVFVRVMTLFSVVDTSLDEDSGIGGQGQLFHMLMVNMGKVTYPEFQIDKKHSIFGSRADVLRFAEALQLEFDFVHATEKGKWDEAYSVFLSVQEKQRALEADQDIVSWNKNLPDYLRAFTATAVVYRLLSQGIEVLQRRKDFSGAVSLLKTLLAQESYCLTYRGYWWERLALNLDAHLKKPEQSLEAVLSGLGDPRVRVGHRLALYLRGKGICERPRLKLNHRLQECCHPPLRELPKVHLEARVLHGTTGAGPRFLTQSSYRKEEDGEGMGDLTVCGVEEFVMDHYRTHGFPSGMHAEGSVTSSLFALFCWDIYFLPRPDAFHSPYQSMPLDLYTDEFYERRKEEIDKRMEDLSNSSVQELQAIAEESWTTHDGVSCVGMNWERMRSADCVKELVACMGPKVLTGILTRYAHSPRHTRSGFPDLTLWNPMTGAFKICEVKGPGDRLSHKQILWLDYLLGLGVDAEVCHVKAVAAKRLLPSS